MSRRPLVPVAVVVVLLSAAPAAAETPSPVSPGASGRFALAAGACPTFSWTAVAGARGYEVVVYRVNDESTRPSLEASLPAGASSWTPAADRCLAAGKRYGWSVRAITETDQVRGEWSEALLFEVAVAPADLAAALDVLRSYLGADALDAALEAARRAGPEASASADDQAGLPLTQKNGDAAAQGAGADAIAVRGDVPGGSGVNFGVAGISHSPDGAGVSAENTAGPDLSLAGSPPAELSESALTRDSAGNLTFDFTNPGAGTMTLQEDSIPVATDASVFPTVLANDGAGSTLDADLLDGLDSTAFLPGGTDLWVDETGDTMTGTLTLSPAAGAALTSTAGDLALHDTATVTKAGERFLWDDSVSVSFAAGRGALASNTSDGVANTAVGSLALTSNTTGALNTAVGRRSLQLNTTGNGNTAVGLRSLYANTSGSYSTALGSRALTLNTTGGMNTASGYAALFSNTTGYQNVASGYTTLFSNTTGVRNTAVGAGAMGGNTTGSGNVALGHIAGDATTGNDNILIAHVGVGAESGAIRIGTGGTHTKAFVAGISGVTTGGAALPVVIDGSGQLGTASGGGGGIDADTLDGLDSAAFVLDIGDTMTGTLNLDPLAGMALTTGPGDDLDLGGNVRKGGTLFLHDNGTNNTGLGISALTANTTGFGNTAVGEQALVANTTGYRNVAVGYRSLLTNTTGTRNVAVGYRALDHNTTASRNTALGNLAMYSNATGNYNAAVGFGALFTNTTGVRNTSIGAGTLFYNTTGNGNSAVGFAALSENTTGNNNTAVGRYALLYNTIGARNAAVGRDALYANIDGADNVAVGFSALGSNTSGSSNIAVGTSAGAATTGSNNIAVGNAGVAAENGVVRIGTSGTHTQTFLAGVRGVTTSVADAIPVVVDSNGQLGTAPFDLLVLAGRSAAPACNNGTVYYDSDDDTFCFCEAGSFTPLDGVGACT